MKRFDTPVDFINNELRNPVIENLASDPVIAVAGKMYYNTVTNLLMYYNGTTWVTSASGGSQNLQEVTDIGFTTTNPLISSIGLAATNANASLGVGENVGVGVALTDGSWLHQRSVFLSIFKDDLPAIVFTQNTLSSTEIRADLANGQVFQFGTVGGNVTVSVDGVFAGSDGNISLGALTAFSLADGSGTTANSSSVDLGGALTTDALFTTLGGKYIFINGGKLDFDNANNSTYINCSGIGGAFSLLIGKTAGDGGTSTGLLAIGYGAGLNNSGFRPSFVGLQAGVNNTGDESAGFGIQSLSGNTGDNSTGIGSFAGSNNIGDRLTALGWGAASAGNTFTDVVSLGYLSHPDANFQLTLAPAITHIFAPGMASTAGYVLMDDGTGHYTPQPGGGGGGAQTFDDVTTLGNTTTNSITVSGLTSNGTVIINNNLVVTGLVEADLGVETGGDQGVIFFGGAGGGDGTIKNTNITGSWVYQLPDASGVFGLSINGIPFGNDGDITLSLGGTPAALTSVDDTNVTISLGGTPSTALLEAVSLTLGWTGTLDDSRITSSADWNTAFSWGDHALAGYLTSVPDLTAVTNVSNITLTGIISDGDMLGYQAMVSANPDDAFLYVFKGKGGRIRLTMPSAFAYTIIGRTSLSADIEYTLPDKHGVSDTFAMVSDIASTDLIAEGLSNLYYTDSRSRAAISLTTTGTGSATYNNTTGVLNIPTPSGGGTVTSVAASISGALSISGSPITGAGTLAFSWTGSTSQYVRGNGSLATFPTAVSTFTNDSNYAVVGANLSTFTNDSVFITASGITNAIVIGKVLTGFSAAAGTVSATDTILQAFNKIVGNIAALPSGSVTSVSGTTNRITVATGTTTPVIDISASYVGQSSITTLGTIATGVWQGTAITDTYISSATVWNAKQAALVSGTNIKTVNSSSLLGSGNLAVGDLLAANNLSDIVNAATARTNLGLGSLATQNGTIANYVDKTTTNTYTAGMKQVFTADSTNAGLKFGGVSANPSSLVAGDIWYRSDLTLLNYYNGTTVKSLLPANTAITGATKTKITYDANGLVTSGADASTSDISEGTNLYYTNARAIAAPITGYTSGSGTVAATDSILQAIQKLNGNTALKLTANGAITAGTKTKITYDVNGLITAGTDAAFSDISDYVAWTDYSSTSTITGISAYATKQIWYSKVGKTLLLWWNIQSTAANGSGTTFTITLPYTAVTAADQNGIFHSLNNGTTQAASVYKIAANSNLLEFSTSSSLTNLTGWINATTKGSQGFAVINIQ